jgi:hypothetical protein
MMATGHQLPRFFMFSGSLVFMLLFYALLDFRHLSWFPPGRTDATSLQLFFAMHLCWFPVSGSILGDSDS